jgi:hypothetical protein
MDLSGQGILERYAGQLSGYFGSHGNVIFPLGLFVQLVIVAVALRTFFRDDQYQLMGFLKAFGYAILFVVGAPIAGQILSALLVWIVPMATRFLDVMTLLKTVSPIDESAATVSRPWAYALAILAGISFFAWRVKSLKRNRFTLLHAGQVALVLLVANALFQLLVYSVVKIWR